MSNMVQLRRKSRLRRSIGMNSSHRTAIQQQAPIMARPSNPLPADPDRSSLFDWAPTTPVRRRSESVRRPGAAHIGSPAEVWAHFSNLLLSPKRTAPESKDKTENDALNRENMPPVLAPKTSQKRKSLRGCSSLHQEDAGLVVERSCKKERDAENQGRNTRMRPRQQKKKLIRPKVIQEAGTEFQKLKTPKQTSERHENQTPNKRRRTEKSKGQILPADEVAVGQCANPILPADEAAVEQGATPSALEKEGNAVQSKSVKRRLGIDLECEVINANKSLLATTDIESQVQEYESMVHSSTRLHTRSTVKITKELEVVIEKSNMGFAFDLNRSLNHVLEEYLRSPGIATPPTGPSGRELTLVTRSSTKQLDKMRGLRSVRDPSFLRSSARPTTFGSTSKRELIYGNTKQCLREVINSSCGSNAILTNAEIVERIRMKGGLCHDRTQKRTQNCDNGIQTDVNFIGECKESDEATKYHNMNSFGLLFDEKYKKRTEVEQTITYPLRQMTHGTMHVFSQSETTTKKRSKLPIEACSSASIASIVEYNQIGRIPDNPQGLMEDLQANGCLRTKAKRRRRKGHESIDNKMKCFDLNQSHVDSRGQPQNALVPYAQDGMIDSPRKPKTSLVPYVQNGMMDSPVQPQNALVPYAQDGMIDSSVQPQNALVPYAQDGMMDSPAQPQTTLVPHAQDGMMDSPAQPQNTLVPYAQDGMMDSPAQPQNTLVPHAQDGMMDIPVQPQNTLIPHTQDGMMDSPTQPQNTLVPYAQDSMMDSPAQPQNTLVPYSQDGMMDSPAQTQNTLVPYAQDGMLDIPAQPQNTVVPYGQDGLMVPYKSTFEPNSKQHPRPKVDLDPETDKVWKQLMGKEVYEEPDTDKQQWWEEQRQVYGGRVDSFIARMHHIQGNRRFSRWKGSVVDSVVGVFLTQNAPDHLSSSAYMSLAARFPARPSGKNEPDSENLSTSEEKAKESMLTIKETIKCQETMSSPEKSDKCFGVTYEVGHLVNKEMFDSYPSHVINKKSGNEDDSHVNRCQLQLDHTQEQVGSSLQTNSKPENNYPSTSCHLDPVSVQRKEVDDVKEESSSDLTLAAFEVTDSDNISPNTETDNAGQQNSTTAQAVDSQASRSRLCPPLIPCLEREVCVEILEKKSCCYNSFPEDRTHSSVSDNFSHSPDLNKDKYEQTDTIGTFHDEDIPHTVEILSHEQDNNIQPTCIYLCETLNAEKLVINGVCSPPKAIPEIPKKSRVKTSKTRTTWDSLRIEAYCNCSQRERNIEKSDIVDWEAVRTANVDEISEAIKVRGMHNKLGQRIKDFLDRLVNDHGSTDLEWLRRIPPGKAKEYLLSIQGLGLKSAECVRLLTLEQQAFPVDTNVGRICVRLGWVPLQPLPESTQLHLLELYPMLETIQQYLWPRLCNLDQRTLYELHYQMITFGKVFCTKKKPNCHACPMRGECRHLASQFSSEKLLLEGPEEKNLTKSLVPVMTALNTSNGSRSECIPIIEEPSTPERSEILEGDIDGNGILNGEIEDFGVNDQILIQEIWDCVKENNLDIHYGEISKAVVSIPKESASIPMPKLKNVIRLRTEHHVYELKDDHPLLKGVEKRVCDDPCPYLLAIWTPGETAESTQSPETCCDFKDIRKLCNNNICLSCNTRREEEAQTIRATLLIPCRTANRGGFPLNGTYFQVNEVFADHASSCQPLSVPRKLLWDLPRRTVYIGASISTIFRGMSIEDITHCFLRGYVCVRGFDRETRKPMPLTGRLHSNLYKGLKSKKFQKQKAQSPP